MPCNCQRLSEGMNPSVVSFPIFWNNHGREKLIMKFSSTYRTTSLKIFMTHSYFRTSKHFICGEMMMGRLLQLWICWFPG